MGNSSSQYRSGGATGHTLRKEGAAAAARLAVDPNDAEIDQVFRALMEAFQVAVAGIGNVDKGMLFLKLLSKLQEEYPWLPVVTPTAKVGIVPASSPERKKQKMSSDGNEQQKVKEQTEPTTVIYPRNTLQGQPFEVLARVANFLHRADINYYGATCRRIHYVVTNPSWVDLPWPLKWPVEPFDLDETDDPPAIFDVPPQVFFSDDNSRVAVYREGCYREFLNNSRLLEVFDRRTGPLGSVDVFPFIHMNPVFSPNNDLLLLPPCYASNEFRLCQLPKSGPKDEIIASSHQIQDSNLYDADVGPMIFLDNETVCFIDERTGKVNRCKIIIKAKQQCTVCWTGYIDRFYFSEPEVFLANHDDRCYSLTSFYGKAKDLLVSDSRDRNGKHYLLLRDIRRKATVIKPIPDEVMDLAFSRDGNLLVVAYSDSLTVFDCSVEKIEDIRLEGKTINFDYSDEFNYDYITWLPAQGSKIALGRIPESRDRWCASHVSIIDIEKEELICDGWDESFWRTMVS